MEQHTLQPKCITNWQEINAKLSVRRHRRSSRTGRYKDTTCQLVDYLSDTPTDVKTLDSTRTCSAHALNTRANFCALIMRRVIRSTPAPPPASSPLHSTPPSTRLVNNIGIISIFKWASSPASPLRGARPLLAVCVLFWLLGPFVSKFMGPQVLSFCGAKRLPDTLDCQLPIAKVESKPISGQELRLPWLPLFAWELVSTGYCQICECDTLKAKLLKFRKLLNLKFQSRLIGIFIRYSFIRNTLTENMFDPV